MRIFGLLIRENNLWSYANILSDEKSISDRKRHEVFWYYLRTSRLPYLVNTQMSIQVSTTMAFQQKTKKYSMRMSIEIFQNASEIFHIPIWYWPEIGPRSVTVSLISHFFVLFIQCKSSNLQVSACTLWSNFKYSLKNHGKSRVQI